MARRTRIITPVATDATDFRIPVPSDKYTASLSLVPRNGEWFILGSRLGLTTSEQTARSLNYDSNEFQWGYRVYSENGTLYSDLAVRLKTKANGGLK